MSVSMKKNILKKLYSVQNKKNKKGKFYKIISISGIKLKFKNKKKNRKEQHRNKVWMFTNTINDIFDKFNQIYARFDQVNNRFDQVNSKQDYILWKNSIPVTYAKNAFEKYYTDKFVTELQILDYEECYKNLIKNLDNNSIETVNRILGRLSILRKYDVPEYDIFDSDEIEIIKRIPRILWDNVIKLNDNCFAYNKYFLPINHFEICVFRDKHEVEHINKEYFKDKDIIDAGGFIGDSAIVLADYTSKNVHTFEPTKENYEILLKTLKLNNKNNIVPSNVGVGDKNEERQIFFAGSASGVFKPVNTEKEESIKLITLDSYVQEHNLNVGLIKTDLEGFEQPFLRGAEQTIKSQKPTLLISIYHCADDFFKIKPMIEAWNLGYKFKIVKPVDGQILLETLLIAEVEG